MTLNDPRVVQAIARLHDDYERALAANDVETLTAYFWDSPQVVRYGVAEQLYGAEALLAYRHGHTPPYSERRLTRREIATFGPSFATVMSEIDLLIDGAVRATRQSQTWVQFPGIGWRIVAAHVSRPLSSGLQPSPWEAYADVMARTLGLPQADAHRAGVVATLERTAAIAAPLLALTLPDDAEPTPVFSA